MWNRTTTKLCSLYPLNNFPQGGGGDTSSQHMCLFLWKFRGNACQIFFSLCICAGCCLPQVWICQKYLCTRFCTLCSHQILICYEIKRPTKMQNRIVMNDIYLCDCKNNDKYSYILLLYSTVERGSMCSVAVLTTKCPATLLLSSFLS